MVAGLLFMDLVWAGGLFGLTYLSATTALAAASCCSGAIAIALAVTVALLTWIGACAVILFLLPKPSPGTYRMLQGGAFYAWAFGFIARRCDRVGEELVDRVRHRVTSWSSSARSFLRA